MLRPSMDSSEHSRMPISRHPSLHRLSGWSKPMAPALQWEMPSNSVPYRRSMHEKEVMRIVAHSARSNRRSGTPRRPQALRV